MSASFRTKDGTFSAVAALHAEEDARGGLVPVELSEALTWATENRVHLVPGEPDRSRLARINAARREWHLPGFSIKESPIFKREGRGDPAPKLAAAHIIEAPPPRSLPTVRPGDAVAFDGQTLDPPPISEAMVTPRASTLLTPLAEPIAASQDDLLSLVMSFDGMKTGLVTPDVARWLLALNTANRPLQPAAVDRFATLLTSGRWVLTGEAIIVSREGILNDGQHRLEAVAQTGVSALCDVRFGIAREAFAATGTGTRRTAGQALAIAGGTHASAQAAVARLLRHYDAREMARYAQQVEPGQVMQIVAETPQILAVVTRQKACKFAPVRSAPVGMVLVAAARKTSMDRALSFLSVLDSGLADDEQNAARRLHVRLRDAAIEKVRLSQIDVAALTVRAWNAWAGGRTLQHLRVGEADRTSAGFPEVAA